MTNEVLKTIYERRSVKKYSDKPVPKELLDEILKAEAEMNKNRKDGK